MVDILKVIEEGGILKNPFEVNVNESGVLPDRTVNDDEEEDSSDDQNEDE